MSDCEICGRIKNKSNLLFENEKVVVMLADRPATPGHMFVLSKEHAPIIEKVPDPVVQEMFVVANKVGISVFESLGAHGTNVLIQNGPAAGQKQNHAVLHVVPRFEKDNLQLSWQPGEQASEESLSSIESLIKAQTGTVGVIEKEKAKPIEETAAEEIPEEDYRAKQLKRIP